ncbi:MAG: radical SAM family heme chaperone HemW [Bacilli bacterium]
MTMKKKIKKNNSRPSALYIHIPFCNHLCNYCDFCKVEYFRHWAKDYLKELFKELDSHNIKSLKTIYIGGGTPTALDDDLFEELLKRVFSYLNGVKEYTIEANVESLTERKLQLMKKYGVNRLSLGVESTDETVLKAINRKHTYADIKKIIPLARSYGFDNINVDLIMGLPNTTLEDLKKDIERILLLEVEHISTYSLIIEKNTIFYHQNIKRKTDEEERAEYDLVHKMLTEHGFLHYEISNFAKPGKKSAHNLTYWKNEQYYGVGLGAAGYLNGRRYQNTRGITSYLRGKRILESEEITPFEDEEYFIILNLRTSDGIDDELFFQKFGHSFIETYRAKIAEFVDNESLILKDKTIYLSYKGMMILDFILLKILN